MSRPPTMSVIVPFLNEEKSLPELISRIRSTKNWPSDFEILFVSDGSTDGSIEYLEREATHDDRIKLVVLTRNFGHQAAVSAGFRYATGKYIGVMDADLQDEPHVLIEMLERLTTHQADVVYAVRQKRTGRFLKRVLYRLFYKLYGAVSDTPVQLDSGDFCVMTRRTLCLLRQLPENIRFHRGLRSWVGLKQIACPVLRPERYAGEAQYSWRALVKLAVSGLTGFSLRPLRISTGLGVLLCLAALMGGLVYIGIGFFSEVPRTSPGFTTIVVLQLFLSGLLFLNLGVLGEYLGCIYLEVKRRPGFLVDRTTNVSQEAAADDIESLPHYSAGVSHEG